MNQEMPPVQAQPALSIHDSVLDTIGNTPLIRLKNFSECAHFNFFAKMECANPGGSLKDRPAYNIIRRAMERGEIDQNTTIIESSSGNFGIGLAQVCASLGLRFFCVLDARANKQNIDIIRAYGGMIEQVMEPDPESGEFLQACIKRVQHLLAELPNSFWPNQHGNVDNAMAHHNTMREISSSLNNQVDYLFCATSTCGTLRGCSEYASENDLGTHIVAVDAEGSLIFSKQQKKRIIPGHGAGKPPHLLKDDLANEHVHVSALESIINCRRMLRGEAILAGGSSGGVISGVLSKASEIPAGSNVVAIICDRGERYLDTVFCDTWVKRHYPDFQDPTQFVNK